jgi:hypothetical protein
MSQSEMMTTRPSLRRDSTLGWAVVAVAGLMLALVATLGPPKGPVVGSPAVRLVITLPDSLQMAIFGLFALVALLVLTLLFPRGLRRRKKDEDEFELAYEGPKPSVWVVIALLGLTLLPLALAGYLFWLKWTPFEQGVLSGPLSSVPRPRPFPPPPEAVRPMAGSPVFTGAVAALALVAGLGALGLVLWIYLGDRIIGGWVGPSARPREGLAEAVEESLESLRREPDPRRAIILCYRRFEQVLARSGLARAPWKTPSEFLGETLRRFAVPPDAVTILTRLFEVSRFSHHPVGQAERNAAVGSLIEIKAALEREDSRGSVA